jgi:hypothetical protein
MAVDHARVERVRKLIDTIALYSLLIDICIACITTLSIMHVETESILIPVNYMLTIVVVLSIGLFAFLFWLKHEEKILDGLLGRKYRYNPNRIDIIGTVNSKVKAMQNKRILKSS